MQFYFIIYKPYLVLSQFTSASGAPVLGDYFQVPGDVYPLGRLDHDSEGLLILSNDRSLNHRLLNPAFSHEREYWVQVDGNITNDALERVSRGIDISVDGKTYHTKPCFVSLFPEAPAVPERTPPVRFRKLIPAPWVRVVVKEGKNRQIRKMFAKTGFPVLRLIRYRIEQIELGSLQPGEMISLSKRTIVKKLFHE